MVKEAAPKDVEVKEVQIGKNPDIDLLAMSLGIDRTPAAMYVGSEKFKIISPTGKAAEDREAIANIGKAEKVSASGTESSSAGWCPAQFRNKESSYEVKLGKTCEVQVEEAKKNLGLGARKNVSAHYTSDDPRVRSLLKHLGDKQ